MEALPQLSRPRTEDHHPSSRSSHASPSTWGHHHSEGIGYPPRSSPSSPTLQALPPHGSETTIDSAFSHRHHTESPADQSPYLPHLPPQHLPQPTKSKTGGLFSFASRIATFSEPVIRRRPSISSIARSPPGPSDPTSPSCEFTYTSLDPRTTSTSQARRPSNQSSSSNQFFTHRPEGHRSSQSLLLQKDNPPSQPYSTADPNRPPPLLLLTSDNKMHQTSSRLLRMTDDDRPFTKVGEDSVTF